MTDQKIRNFYKSLSEQDLLPQNHVKYLKSLKENGFEPKVIYDIGSCVLHWTRHAKRIWPNAQIILFDANPYCEFLYNDYQYYNGLLSNQSHILKKFYLNEFSPGGASYNREIGSPNSELLYPETRFYTMETMTLDDIVKEKKFPLPDLVKMDVQGTEKDIMEGGIKTMENAKHLIMELPKRNVQYNLNAATAEQIINLSTKLGWTCTAPLFSDNGQFDGDYGFSKKMN